MQICSTAIVPGDQLLDSQNLGIILKNAGKSQRQRPVALN